MLLRTVMTKAIALAILALYLALGTHAIVHAQSDGAAADTCAVCHLERTPAETSEPAAEPPVRWRALRAFQPLLPPTAAATISKHPRGPPRRA